MATTTSVDTLFTNLETQRQILTKCTQLYKSLTTHFATLTETLTHKSNTLTTHLETLDSNHQKALLELDAREESIPARLQSLSLVVEKQKEEAMREVGRGEVGEGDGVVEVLRWHCGRMDGVGLVRAVVGRRKEVVGLRGEVRGVLEGACVDAPRLVVEVVREFLFHKKAGKGGVTDMRWGAAVVVGGLFGVEEVGGRRGEKGVVFSRKAVERAEEVVREWREMAAGEEGRREGGSGVGMGPAEAGMFLTFVVGFGLREIVGEEYCRKLVVEFCNRKDMARLALPLFGDKVGG